MKVRNYSTDSSIVRLTKYRKKGLLRIIFSRLGGIILLLYLQVSLVFSLFTWFESYVPYYSTVKVVFTTIMIIYLFNCEMDSSAKLTWMFIISMFPLPGSIFFAFTRFEIGHIAMKRRMLRIIDDTRDALPPQNDVLKELENDESGITEMSQYLSKTGDFPIYNNTEVTYFSGGEQKFEALLEELEKAEKFIFLEYFIITEGYMWGRILKILIDKVKQGVEVRVLYDGMCEMSLLPHNYAERLQTFGINAKTFSKIHPFVSTYYNYRDHRKVLVIDGKVAFNGGVNLADEYINRYERFGHWKDSAVMVKGDAVKAYTLMFLQMWAEDTGVVELGKYLEADSSPRQITKDSSLDLSAGNDDNDHPEEDGKFGPSGYVMPYSDIPLDDEKVGENIYMDVLSRAHNYVHIMTPYLVLDDELRTSIKYAASRGVEISIILPGIADKKMAYALAKSHYRDLIRSGVHLYEYTPGFVHTKNFVSDDEKAIVGTINLDYRSLYHHFECATYMYKTDCVADVERDFQETLAKCREVTFDTIKHEKIYYKLMAPIVKLIAPLM